MSATPTPRRLGAALAEQRGFTKLSLAEIDRRIDALKATSNARGIYWDRDQGNQALYDALIYARNLHHGAVQDITPGANDFLGDGVNGGAP